MHSENAGWTDLFSQLTPPLPANFWKHWRATTRHDPETRRKIAPRHVVSSDTTSVVCRSPNLPPMVGYARTTTIRSVLASRLRAEQQQRRIAYYE